MSLHSMQQDGLRRQLEKELLKNQELQLINRQLREEIQKLKINLQSNEFMLQEMSEEIEKMYNSDRVPLKVAQLVKAYQIKLQEILVQKATAEAIAAEKEQKKRIYTAVKTAEKKIHAAYLHKIKIIQNDIYN